MVDEKPKMMKDILDRWAIEKKDKISFEFEGETTTYGEGQLQNYSIANGFIALGLKKGQPACVMLPNSLDFIAASFGLGTAGGIFVPLNNAYRGDILIHVLNDCEAEMVVIHSSFIDRIEFVAKDLKFLKTLIVCQDKNEAPMTKKKVGKFTVLPFEELKKYPSTPPPVELLPQDISAIMYTSGTTGLSKGAISTNRGGFQAAVDHAKFCGLTENDVIYVSLPLFHGISLGLSVGSALAVGAKVVISSFNLEKFWKEVKACKATYFSTVSAICSFLLMMPEDDDKNNDVRVVYTIPTPAAEDYKKFVERFGVKFVEAYGSTDGGTVTYTDFDHPKIGSCGKVVDGYELKIVDDDEEEVPCGVTGEILYRHKEPWVMSQGYYKNPQATVDSRRNFWYHSGDSGYMDEDGYLHFVDRKKDALRRRGENVSSFEIEKIFNSHPDVVESAVVAVPSDVGEDDIKICVMMQSGKTIDPIELLNFCEVRMPYYMIPRYVEFLSDFPRTPVGKVQKFILREQGITSDTWDAKKAGYKPKK